MVQIACCMLQLEHGKDDVPRLIELWQCSLCSPTFRLGLGVSRMHAHLGNDFCLQHLGVSLCSISQLHASARSNDHVMLLVLWREQGLCSCSLSSSR